MGCLRVHFAITEAEANKLIFLETDDARLEFVQEDVEETYFGGEQELMCQTDKAWDAIHRALTDGHLGYENGNYPLSHVILGGMPLFTGDRYIMSLKIPADVQEIASAIGEVDEERFRSQYFLINSEEYGFPINDEDFGYTWYWLERLQQFYQRAAAASRFVLFTADQ